MRHTVVLVCLASTFVMDFVYRHKGCVCVVIHPSPSFLVYHLLLFVLFQCQKGRRDLTLEG